MMATILALPPARQRVVAIGLAVGVVGLLLALVLVPVYWIHHRYDTAIEGFRTRLETYRRVAAQAPEYRKALDAMKARDGRRFYLKNTAANLAGAELQELVRNAVESNGGRISTSQNVVPKDEGRVRQIGVTVQFFASTPNLQKILHSVELQVPYLVVDSLTLRPLNAFRGFKPAPGQEPDVNVTLDVAAFMLADAAKK